MPEDIVQWIHPYTQKRIISDPTDVSKMKDMTISIEEQYRSAVISEVLLSLQRNNGMLISKSIAKP